MKTNRTVGLAVLATTSLILTACGGGDSGGEEEQAAAGLEDRGPITYVQGKDNSGVVPPLVEKWNADHPEEQVTFKELTDEADQQHEAMVQNFQAESTGYDVLSVDVVWTAEFAAKGWLQALEGDTAVDTASFLPATVDAATYDGKLYAAPVSSDGGMLYYRKDLVKTPPESWDEMMDMCSIAEENDMDCYAGQFSEYEGLTVNAAEAINTFGGEIVDDAGAPTVDSEESRAGLEALATAYKEGNIPKDGITYTEEEGRISFQNGDLLFLRNWPYVYGLATTDETSKIKGKFEAAPLPGSGDGPGASSLGGHSAAISVYSENKATALDFLKFLTSEEQQRVFLEEGSLAPVITSLYDDPELAKKFGYLPVLKTSIENAVPRPVTPYYPAVTEAIQQNAYQAIKGDKSVDQAITDMQAAIDQAAAG
ncbi:MAG: ABC transporter substrate-binding protein [Nocardioidaceae bacterium]|nr:ABC transporter substrate-binding protein [Nocardioidaceae bacterium]